MGLQTAFYAARSALFTTSAQTATVSRNIAGVNEAGYARRTMLLETLGDGGVRAITVGRATDVALRNKMLSANSGAATQDAVVSAYEMLHGTVGDPTNANSPAALIGSLKAALTTAAAAPQDASAATSAINAARKLASSLVNATSVIQNVRANADASMSDAVAKINSLLSDFDSINTTIVHGTKTGADITDALDKRDSILKDLSTQIGISVVPGRNGDVAIYTDSGATLFQDGPRTVSMAPTLSFTAGISGAAVFVDGVAVTGKSAPMQTQSGAIAGLARVRDQDALIYQSQLDEVARGLINAFVQKDQSATPTLPDVTGLFTWSGAPGVPNSTFVGLAGDIRIDASVDPASGGDWTLLRDGGIKQTNSAYKYNASGAQGFSARLRGLVDQLSAPQNFDPGTQLSTKTSVINLATASAGWLEAQRKAATDAGDLASAVAAQSSAALSNATGVNIDDQMSQMLDLEHSYQASAKMLSTIDSLYTALFNSMR